MKILYQALICMLLTGICVACGDSYELGDVPDTGDLQYTVTPSTENPNVINFNFKSDGMSPFWSITKPDGQVMTSSKRNFSLTYLMAGDYTGILRGYGHGGLSDSLAFKFNVPKNDSRIWLLSGKDGNKKWIWDSDNAGHLACGSIKSDGPDWWITVPNELNQLKTYDDELNFSLTDYKYNLDAHGYVYVDPSALSTMDPVHYPNGGKKGVPVAYTQPDNQKWSVYERDGKLYLSFSNGGFPSYVAGPKALGAEYEVLVLTEEELYLKWNDTANETSWYYRFKAK